MQKNWRQPEPERDVRKTDYGKYRLSVRETGLCLLWAAALTAAVSYLFYRSWIGFLAAPAVFFFLKKREEKQRRKRRMERLAVQFKDTIRTVSSGIQAGYSIENAFLEARQEICVLYGSKSEMARELDIVQKGLKNRIPLEELLSDLGIRSHVEEISDFAECFAAAKRQGGNLKEITRRTVELTGQKIEVEREIAAMLWDKQYEQKVMNGIPFLLLGYMQLTARGFFDVLYHNTAGICIMTGCLALYLAALALSERILDIRL